MAGILGVLDTCMEQIVEVAILLFEFIGVGIIIYSGLRGFHLYLKRSPETKLTLAKGLAMGLEFKKRRRRKKPTSFKLHVQKQRAGTSCGVPALFEAIVSTAAGCYFFLFLARKPRTIQAAATTRITTGATTLVASPVLGTIGFFWGF